MFSLTRYTTPCPEPVNSQILQMVVDNLTLVGIGLCMILVGSVVGALSSLLSTMRHLKI